MVVLEAALIGGVSQARGPRRRACAVARARSSSSTCRASAGRSSSTCPRLFLAQMTMAILVATALAGLYPARRASASPRSARCTRNDRWGSGPDGVGAGPDECALRGRSGVVPVDDADCGGGAGCAPRGVMAGRAERLAVMVACIVLACVAGRIRRARRLGARDPAYRISAAARSRDPSGAQDRVVVLHRQSRGSAAGRRFGYQLTFFRVGVDPSPANPSRWAVRDLYMAHFAITDRARPAVSIGRPAQPRRHRDGRALRSIR